MTVVHGLEGPDLTGLRDPEWTEQLEAGDLHVWVPSQMPDRRLAVVLGHSDGDQPLTLAALVAAGPLPELPA
ncbi:hypothetical protein ACSNN7_06980 [Micromonospora sp. URMC 105]|uniref:hypothetical protein n=1 Tax=Micromonospora sp. URMC 105 TaxID=3423413 RepID=UPI003F19BFCD